MPIAHTPFLDRRDISRLDTTHLPTHDNSTLLDQPRDTFCRRDLLVQRKEVEEGAAMKHVNTTLLQVGPHSALRSTLEGIGDYELRA